MEREITIGVCNEWQSCDLMKLRTYHSTQLPYCTLFKTFLQFREYENIIAFKVDQAILKHEFRIENDINYIAS